MILDKKLIFLEFWEFFFPVVVGKEERSDGSFSEKNPSSRKDAWSPLTPIKR